MRGTNEIELSSNWCIRQRSCFLPCTNGLHALCQGGAFTEMLAVWRARSAFGEGRLVYKSSIISWLPESRFAAQMEIVTGAGSAKSRIACRPVSNREEQAVRLFQIGALCCSVRGQPAGDRAGEITGAGYTRRRQPPPAERFGGGTWRVGDL